MTQTCEEKFHGNASKNKQNERKKKNRILANIIPCVIFTKQRRNNRSVNTLNQFETQPNFMIWNRVQEK